MSTKGFTLLELSIVIVIIGLIVAGISAGQSLVKQAQIRNVATDVTMYRGAINAFKLQYDALPGDMANASSYWSGVLDGNGDNNISTALKNDTENSSAFEHLGLANLIDGDYTGAAAYAPDVNIPRAPYPSTAVWSFAATGVFGLYSSARLFYLSLPVNNAGVNGSVVPSIDAASIDRKYDDGQPFLGSIIAYGNTGADGNCVDDGPNGFVGVKSDVSYTLGTDACVLGFSVEGNAIK